MPKRKTNAGDDADSDQTIPLPIQTFFWRQTSPFIRPKLGKLSESACVSLERVVVQNILHGLSISICEALQSVSRWKVIQAAFPHVMHACAALITQCKQNDFDAQFGPNETKLLYILHWIILDAASECEDIDTDTGQNGSTFQLHSLSTIQLFIYLIAPIIHMLNDTDFQTLKLENGLRLWQPLWDYRQPDIPCFSTPVKPQRNVLKAQRNLLKVNTNAANIYIGKGTSRENLTFPFEAASRKSSYNEPVSPLAPLARWSDICPQSTVDSQSTVTNVEILCEYCNNVSLQSPTERSCQYCKDDGLGVYPFSNVKKRPSTVDADLLKQRLANAATSGIRGPTVPDILSASYFDIAIIRCLFCSHWSEDGIYWALKYVQQRLLEVCDEFTRLDFSGRERSHSLPFPDQQLLKKLGSPFTSMERQLGKKSSFSAKSTKLATIPSTGEISATDTEFTAKTEMKKEPPFKRSRVGEIKRFYDPNAASGEDSNQTEQDHHHFPGTGYDYKKQTTKSGLEQRHFQSQLINYDKNRYGGLKYNERRYAQYLKKDESGTPGSVYTDGLNGGNRHVGVTSTKSVTFPLKLTSAARNSSSYAGIKMSSSDRESIETSSHESSNSSQVDDLVPGMRSDELATDDKKKPVIKVTEHSQERRDRMSAMLHSSKSNDSTSSNLKSGGNDSGLSRSMTDTDISYVQDEEVHEVPGSVHYIQDNGHLNYKVILRAVHFIAANQPSERVCEVLLNIINCLLDLDIVERKKNPSTASNPETPESEDKKEEKIQTSNSETSGETAHGIAMDSIFSIFKALGCPNGCGDGVRGHHGDHLRSKGHNCLHRLQRINPTEFKSYLRDSVKKCPIQETVDFLHAFLGFCIDPSFILQQSCNQERKRSSTQDTMGQSQSNFSNNFGHSIGGMGHRGVEGILISNILKPVISKCVENTRELYCSDNISLFCDVRQLMAYIKEIHGGTFRRVELSGLLDSVLKLKKQEAEKDTKLKTTIPMRRTTSQTSESGDETIKAATPSSTEEIPVSSKPRKSIFKKRDKLAKSLTIQPYTAASDSELLDEVKHHKHGSNAHSVTDDDSVSSSGTARRRFSKFHIGWRRMAKSDHEDDALSDPPPLDRRESKSEIQVPRSGLKGKMSFKTASHATITFLSARKKIGGLKSLGKRMSKRGSMDDWKQKELTQADDTETDSIIMKEKKLVDKYLVKSGMLRFSFLLECCHPGSIPDPQLVASMLELEAPVVARAALLLECAQFIHRCNHGDWPGWMRLNLPSFRQSASALQSRGQPSGYRRTLQLQKAAGRMFYKWAENLGSMMEYILSKENTDRLHIISEVRSETKKKELRIADEEEDFLDEATVNETGSECPYALKMMGCLVLQEITTFLRETFRDLTKTRSPRRDTVWDRGGASRRWSSIVSSPGHSQSSESNMADVPHSSSDKMIGSPGVGERKISFAVLGERSDSIHSSTTSISMLDPSVSPNFLSDEKKGRRLAQGRQKLLKHFRRGSSHNSSFRQRSFRQKHGSSFKRLDSFKSRKVSSQSLQSEKEKFFDEPEQMEDAESLLSDEANEPVQDHVEPDDGSLCHNMPWIKVVVQLANLSNFICPHQDYCHPNCYERQRRSCSRLVTAVKKVYQSTENDEESEKKEMKKDFLKERLKRRESIFQQSSPTRRRESTPLLEKIKTDVSMSKLKLNSAWKREDKPKEIKEESAIIKYINSQAQKLTQCPMGIVAKAAPILTEDNLSDIMPVAWELLLESDQELAAAAASVYLLTSVKAPEKASKLVIKELQHEDTSQRINAVLRFGILWMYRHQVWPRMEEGANLLFKIPPPSIDFTLPSPTIGLPAQTVVDPPWTPHFKAKIEEVTVNQEGSKSLVTATTTRRKEQQEMIRKAFQAEEERKRVGREKFQMTTVPVNQLAAYEPVLHHPSEEHDEAVMSDELSNLAARRVSLAPVNRANIQSRSMSWRNGSVHWGRVGVEGDEERADHVHHMQPIQTFFPSCICSAVLPIIHLLDDGDVNTEGIAVNEVAEKIIWNSIVEDPVLFLRHFLEKLTHREKREELLFLLRKLVLHYKDLPAQMAHALFNYLIGYIMFYVRSPCAGSQEAIAGALSLIWLVIPSVEGIYFKDLKQTLKKEQCDPYILISAYVPSAKKILVNGPDQTRIPSQLPVHEDKQFSQILQESLEFFNIPVEDYDSYFLTDTKSGQIHNLNSYVRDFYFFRRNFYPQLSLVAMNQDDAFASLERQAFILKFVEIGKVLFTTNVLKSTSPHQMQNHISFLHEEFLKLPSFPRKALEAEFGLYNGKGGEELYGLDTLHKFSWVKLIATFFSSMTSTFAWTNDLLLFLNVINGCIILHCDDTALLRYCLATLINTCRHFKHVFSMNGFMYIMPTILKTYSNNQPNPLLCQAIEFICRQFYILHRKPFILQMFGSITALLDVTSSETGLMDCRKIQPDSLFRLLLSLERPDCRDILGVLDLVQGEKPLKAIDFCYENDPDRLQMIEVINMCVTVIAYAPDTFRSVQMLSVLEVIVPKYLQHIKSETIRIDKPHAARSEVSIITNLGVSIRALISSCENFTRTMSVPRQLENEGKPKSVTSNHSPLGGTSYYDDREDSHVSRHAEEGRKKQYTQDVEELELANEFRKPRDSLLNVVCEYYSTCQPRLRCADLRRLLQEPTFRPPELLDPKCHNRLAEIAHTLLKLAPYDPLTLSCTGLQRYMTEILPLTNWKQEAVRPGLNLILRRLDRLFNKISKKSSLRRQADWNAAANLLRGIFLTLKKFRDMAQFPYMKTLVNALLSIILSGPGAPILPDSGPGMHGSHRSEYGTVFHLTPAAFCSAVVKLVAMQMQALGDQFSLEQICGGVSVFPMPDKCINMLVNFILPLCIRLGCGRRGDIPRMRSEDIRFALTVILNVLIPPVKVPTQQNSSSKSGMHHFSFNENHRCSSFSHTYEKPAKQENDLLFHTAFLGLEILMTCFDRILSPEWHKVTKWIQDMVKKGKVSLPLWKFVDFVVTHRPAIFLLLQPFIHFKMMKINCDTAQEYYLQQAIKDKLQGFSFTHPKCSASIVLYLSTELQCIKEEFFNFGEYRSRSATMTTERSEFPQTQFNDQHRASITDVAIDIINPAPKNAVPTSAKRPSGGTIFSQSSSNNSQPFKNTVVAHSVDSSGSPTNGERKTSRRISAKEGSSILEKYSKPTVDDTSPDSGAFQESSRLSRQPTICLRSPLSSKQNSFDEPHQAGVLYENEEMDTPNGGAGIPLAQHVMSPDLDPKAHRLQRQDAKSRKTFKRKKTKTASMRRFLHRYHQEDTSDGEGASTENLSTHRSLSMRRPEHEPPYRQRTRVALGQSDRQISLSHQENLSHTGLSERELLHLQQSRSSPGSAAIGEQEVLSLHQARGGPFGASDGSVAIRSNEMIPESVEMKTLLALHQGQLSQVTNFVSPAHSIKMQSSRQRYIQRSKSHDDPYADSAAPAGTARGRIARQGARIVRSRSPSYSPVRSKQTSTTTTSTADTKSPAVSPTRRQGYISRTGSLEQSKRSPPIGSPPVRRPARRVKSPQSKPQQSYTSPLASPVRQAYVAQYDSSDSLNANESSALLKDNDSGQSQSSVCIYFDDKVKRDTVV